MPLGTSRPDFVQLKAVKMNYFQCKRLRGRRATARSRASNCPAFLFWITITTFSLHIVLFSFSRQDIPSIRTGRQFGRVRIFQAFAVMILKRWAEQDWIMLLVFTNWQQTFDSDCHCCYQGNGQKRFGATLHLTGF